jgi:cell division protein FtsB
MSHTDFTNDNNTSIVVIPEYSLIYDVKTEGLRDKTYIELKNEFSEKVIRCPCSSKDKVFDITSGWVRTHFKSQKHILWKTQVQKDHIQDFGPCCPPEYIINVLSKVNRSLKCQVSQLTDDTAILTADRDKLSNEIDKLKQDALKTTNEVIDLKWEIKKAGEKYSKLIEENTKLIEDNAKQLYFNSKLIDSNKKLIAENSKLKYEEIEIEEFVDCS